MADEAAGTLSQEAETPSPPAQAQTFGDMKATVELAHPILTPSGTDDKGQDAEAAKKAEEEAAVKEEKTKEEMDRLDKHPRFQELIKGRQEDRETIAELKGRLEALQTQVVAGSRGTETQESGATEDLSFQDLSQMDDDSLVSLMSEKPREFLGNLTRQLLHELTPLVVKQAASQIESKTTAQTTEQRVAQTYKDFESKNPDFGKMWDSGSIRKFMDDNPGHNAISAYHVLTSEGKEAEIQKRIDEAVAKAGKEKQEKATADLKAKQGAAVLGAGPAGSTSTNTIPAELKDPRKFGGTLKVLAARSAARLAQRGG